MPPPGYNPSGDPSNLALPTAEDNPDPTYIPSQTSSSTTTNNSNSNGGGDLSSQLAAALGPFFGQTSGITQQELAQQQQQFEQQLAFAQAQMQAIGIPQVQIQQQLADMQAQQFTQQLALAQQQQNFSQATTTAGLTGYYTPPTTPGTPGGTSPLAGQYTPGQVVRDANTGAMGVVGANGAVTPGDASNQTIYQATQTPGAIYTVPDASFSAATAAGAPGASTPGQPTQTLAGQQQAFQQALDAAGLTGSYNGNQTQAAQLQAANIVAQQAGLTGTYGGSPTEAAREFNASNSLAQGQLGQTYLSQAAQFAASNPFALSNYMYGAQQGGAPQFIQNLLSNVHQSAAGPVQGQAPTAVNTTDLQNAMGGGSGGVGPASNPMTGGFAGTVMPDKSGVAGGNPMTVGANNAMSMGTGMGGSGNGSDIGPSGAALSPQSGFMPGSANAATGFGPNGFAQTGAAQQGINQVYQQGANALAPGTLEALNQNDMNTLQTGIQQQYGQQAWPAFLQQYQATRPMQTAATSASFAG